MMMTSASTYGAAGYPTTTTLSDGCGAGEESASSGSGAGAKRSLATVPLASDPCKKRRKQSTPIRISTGGVADDVNGSLAEGKLGPFLSSSPDHSPEGTPTVAPAPTTHLCLSQIATDEHLLSHVKIEDAAVPGDDVAAATADSPVNLSGGQNFPAWMSDVHMPTKSDEWIGGASTGGAGVGTGSGSGYTPVYMGAAHSYPHGELAISGQGRPSTQPPIRIFNPDAYCELCNKEFCNKYFLKTHKANKHRIYSDPPASSTGATIPLPDTPPALSVTVPTFKRTNEIPKPGIPPPPLYCDICGKAFCNKKMLRTHRAITHGFMPEYDQGADSGDSERGPALPDDEPELEPEQPDANTSEEDNAPMRNGHALKEETVGEPDETSSAPVPPVQLQPQISQLPQQQRDPNDFTTNRLRRLGIMNPEAFCEICCKEYCNKYFLRTHKMKRHGILIPDDNSKDNQKDFKLELSISNNWYQIQTSPLNLIMGEQSTNSSGSCGERKSSPPNENECELCGMRFQTAYLAQLHAAAAHCRLPPASTPAPLPETTTTTNTTASTADTISEDLQKLQTMILQLNDLDVSRVGGNVCHLCNRDFDNKYQMHAHLMTEHGTLLEEPTGMDPVERQTASETDPPELITCKSCGRDGFTTETLKQHMTECRGTQPPTASAHLLPDTKDDSNGFTNSDKTPNRNQMGVTAERRSSVTLTPTSSYCEICNKELCNKYFMKTHMQRMHGIEIENGAQIGGVVCNICNKELCSKYFLRVHKHNTHGIVEEGSGASGPPASTTRTGSEPEQVSEQPVPTDAALKPADLSDLSHRYFTHFTEVCSICGRRFRSTKWLKAHLLGDHGKVGADKWAELEAQLQQSFGQHGRKGNAIPVPDRAISPATLRIPNGSGAGGGSVIVSASTPVQDSITNVKHGVQTVLSSFFGTDETNVKQYHCSFCSFSTPILAFLFVHERSHARPPSGSEPDTMPLQCAVCNQTFRQPEQLHHHVLSQHPFLSLGPFFAPAQPAHFNTNDQTVKQESSDINETQQQPASGAQTEHKCSKCTSCGRARRQARTTPRHLEISADVSSTLKDVSKQSQLPTTYALPQRPHQQIKYVMQAFLMDEPGAAVTAGVTGTASGTTSPASSCEALPATQRTGADRRFAPSIVFLPVLERLTGPLTVSFTLTPA